ncbi:MAG: hypothetical protein PF437_07995 [Sulfurimonas sp.]|jgi:hypothetical protein|nr:hypothetical protein [Sulfurimonas sp.]
MAYSEEKREQKNAANEARKSMTSAEYRKLTYNDMSEKQHQEQLIHYLDKRGIYYEISLSGIYFPNPHTKGSSAWMKQNKANTVEISKFI